MSESQQEFNMMGPGARLRHAREATRLTVNDISRYLHLKPDVITDIEQDNYVRAPRLVFLRGYIRAYAKLMNLSGDELISLLESYYIEDKPIEVKISSKPRVPYDFEAKRWLHWLSAAIGVVLISFIAIWWHWQKVTISKPTSGMPISLVNSTDASQTIAEVTNNTGVISDKHDEATKSGTEGTVVADKAGKQKQSTANEFRLLPKSEINNDKEAAKTSGNKDITTAEANSGGLSEAIEEDEEAGA
jgi:cytoskeleton protein RodZ